MPVTTVVGTRTVVFGGTYCNRWRNVIVCPSPPNPGQTANVLEGFTGIWRVGVEYSGLNYRFGIEGFLDASPPISLNCGVAPADATLRHRIRIRINGTEVELDTSDSTVVQSAPGSWDWTTTGTWSVTIVCDVLHIKYDFDELYPGEVDGDGFPEWSPEMPDSGLVAVQEGTLGRAERWALRAKAGTNVVIEAGGVSYSHAITTGNQFVLGYRTEAYAKLWTQQVAGEVYVTSSFGDQPIGQPETHTHTDGTEFSIEHGAKVSCPGGLNLPLGIGTLGTLYPTKQLGFRGHLASFEHPYPGSVTARISTVKDGGYYDVALDPDGSHQWDQSRYSYLGIHTDTGVWSGSLDEWQPVRAWLRPSSLEAAGHDSEDWRLPLYGVRWPAFKLRHLPNSILTDTVDDWSAVANATVTSSGGDVQIAVAGGTGSAKWEPEEEVNCEAWRYLRVRIKASGSSKPFHLKLTHTEGESKEFSRKTGSAGAFTNVDIDLRFEDSRPDDWADQESRWPLKGSGLLPLESKQQWGVNSFDTLTIEGLEDGETYTVESIRLIRKSWSKVSFVSAHKLWREQTDGGSKTIRPLMYSDVDGRMYDWWGQRKSPHEWPSITSAMTDFFLPGWSASDPGSADAYHNNSREAELLLGRGLLYDGTAEPYWTRTYGTEVTSSDEGTVVTAQAQYDETDVFPDAGQVWSGSYGGRTWIGFGKLLGNRLTGVTFGESAAASGRKVEMLGDSTDTLYGSGISGTYGAYSTGPPFAGYDLSVYGKSKTVSTDPWPTFDRAIHHRIFVVPVTEGGIHLAVIRQTAMHVAVSYGDMLRHWRWTTVQEPTSIDVADVESTEAQIAVGTQGQLWIASCEGGTVYTRLSTDHGDTWSDPVSVASGTEVAFAIDDKTAAQYMVVWSDPDFVCHRSRDGGATWEEAGVVVTDDEARGGLEISPEADRRLTFALSGDEIRRFVSTDFGENWEEVV